MQSQDYQDKIRAEFEDARAHYELMEKKYIISSATFPRYPSKDGYYRMQVADSSKPSGRKMIAARSMEALEEKYYQWQKTSKDGRCKKTVKDIFEIVQREKLDYVKSEEALYSAQNTEKRNRNDYNRFVSGTRFEKMFISEISKKDIEDIIFLNLKRYELNKKRFDSLNAIIRSVFDMAFQESWIDDNPFLRVNSKKFSKMIVDDTPIEERCHSTDDISLMLGYIHKKQLSKRSSISAYALELQILIALRRGEVSPLKWEDITSFLFIRREMIERQASRNTNEPKYAIVEHTKTHKNRKYPLTTELGEFLERLKAFHEASGIVSPFLFPIDNEFGCLTVKSIYSFYYRMCKDLNIPIDKAFIKGTHAFRRTRITEVTNKSGGNIILAAQLFGNSPQIAKKHYYTGLDMEEAKRVLES